MRADMLRSMDLTETELLDAVSWVLRRNSKMGSRGNPRKAVMIREASILINFGISISQWSLKPTSSRQLFHPDLLSFQISAFSSWIWAWKAWRDQCWEQPGAGHGGPGTVLRWKRDPLASTASGWVSPAVNSEDWRKQALIFGFIDLLDFLNVSKLKCISKNPHKGIQEKLGTKSD